MGLPYLLGLSPYLTQEPIPPLCPILWSFLPSLPRLLDWLPALELNSSGVLAGEQAERPALGPAFISHWGLSEASHAWSYWLQSHPSLWK